MLNKRKRVLIAITFTIIMIILTATTNIIEQYKSNENMILAVVWALTKNYKIRQIILIVAIIMVIFSITATSFSSIYYILICGGVGVIIYFFKKNIKR